MIIMTNINFEFKEKIEAPLDQLEGIVLGDLRRYNIGRDGYAALESRYENDLTIQKSFPRKGLIVLMAENFSDDNTMLSVEYPEKDGE